MSPITVCQKASFNEGYLKKISTGDEEPIGSCVLSNSLLIFPTSFLIEKNLPHFQGVVSWGSYGVPYNCGRAYAPLKDDFVIRSVRNRRIDDYVLNIFCPTRNWTKAFTHYDAPYLNEYIHIYNFFYIYTVQLVCYLSLARKYGLTMVITLFPRNAFF